MASYARRCHRILNSFLKSPIHSCTPSFQLKGSNSLFEDFAALFHSCAVRHFHQDPNPMAVRGLTSLNNSHSALQFDSWRSYGQVSAKSSSRLPITTSSYSPHTKHTKQQAGVSTSQHKRSSSRVRPQIKNGRTYSAATATYCQDSSFFRSKKSEDDVKIRTSAVCHVKPALQFENHWFPLSNMDMLMPSVYEQSFFVYHSSKGRAFGDIVASLKRTLSEVLIPYYPLAGRLKNPEEGIYSLQCNGLGAEFAEAYADVELEELDYHQPSPNLGRRLAPSSVVRGPAHDDGIAALCIQVTRFRCGGIILGCSFHHQVADVFSGSMFLKAWSQIMREQPISRLPYHWRSVLQARSRPRASMDHGREYRVRQRNEVRMPRPVPTTAEEALPIVAKSFHFDHAALRNLKREVRGDGHLGSFTTTESTTAYFWRLIMRARGFGEEGRAATAGKMIMSVDGRKRLQNPSVPEDYFGNLIALASSQLTMDDLLRRPLSYAAAVLQRSVARTATNESFRSLIDFVELSKPNTVIPNFNIFTDPVVIASSCIRLPMYEVDFGWGRPQYAGYASIPEGVANFVILLPSPLGCGNVNACVTLRADHMDKLLRDPEFESVAAANDSLDRTQLLAAPLAAV